MNHPPDHERLLADVLAEAAPHGFREAVLGETLRLARRRRRSRQLRRAACLLAVLGLAGAFLWKNLPHRQTVPAPRTASCPIIHSQPLPIASIVTTQPLPAARIVASLATVRTITTASAGFPIREIGDEELLALIAPRPAALVRYGPHEAKLVFVNPEDQDGFPLN